MEILKCYNIVLPPKHPRNSAFWGGGPSYQGIRQSSGPCWGWLAGSGPRPEGHSSQLGWVGSGSLQGVTYTKKRESVRWDIFNHLSYEFLFSLAGYGALISKNNAGRVTQNNDSLLESMTSWTKHKDLYYHRMLLRLNISNQINSVFQTIHLG